MSFLRNILLGPSEAKQRSEALNLGLFVLRVGVGICFMVHGWPKITQQPPATWEGIGGVMGMFGIGFAPAFWGFMAALAEFGGGLLLVLGLFARPAAFLMAVTMAVAFEMHRNKGDDFGAFSHALELFFVFAALTQTGAGAWSLDSLLFGKCCTDDKGSCCSAEKTC